MLRTSASQPVPAHVRHADARRRRQACARGRAAGPGTRHRPLPSARTAAACRGRCRARAGSVVRNQRRPGRARAAAPSPAPRRRRRAGSRASAARMVFASELTGACDAQPLEGGIAHRAEIGAARVDQDQRAQPGSQRALGARQLAALAADRLAQRARDHLEAGLDHVVGVVAAHLRCRLSPAVSHSERKKCGTSSVGRSPTLSRGNSPSKTKYGRPDKSSAALASVSSIGSVKP